MGENVLRYKKQKTTSLNNNKTLMTSSSNQQRQQQLAQWVLKELSGDDDSQRAIPLKAITSDAGFRRYFRVQTPQGALIAVDAPPTTEDTDAFVNIANAWRMGQVRVPRVLAVNLRQGFMLQEDLGNTPLQSVLNHQTADQYYLQCFETLQAIQQQPSKQLPEYNEELMSFELSLYLDWFLKKLLGFDSDIPGVNGMFNGLVKTILQQPSGTVHRDYHSRNLMVLPDGELGVIDFQGALHGPQLYDVVSLLKDCYVQWPREKVYEWLHLFTEQHSELKQFNTDVLRTWFDFTGLQRHFKCLGIFSRLWLRDGKSGYLAHIPRTFDYVLSVCRQYPQFQPHARWLEQKVQPVLAERLTTVREEASV